MGKLNGNTMNNLLGVFTSKEFEKEVIELGEGIFALERSVNAAGKVVTEALRVSNPDRFEHYQEYLKELKKQHGSVDDDGGIIITTFRDVLFLNDLEREMNGEIPSEQTALFFLSETLNLEQQEVLMKIVKDITLSARKV